MGVFCSTKIYDNFLIKEDFEILENIKSLQLSPSVLENLVQKHYLENKKIISLEGNLLRLAIDAKIPRDEFIKFYIGNEINPNLKKTVQNLSYPQNNNFLCLNDVCKILHNDNNTK